ncbi:MAG TPA: C-GCAxxG-C-C family protein [Geobacteraceae bacterium]|nr:C-GCAxxG-C-C family protein [Geobacteraceae bacterium]
MFELKQEESPADIIAEVEAEAERLFRTKKMNCAESALSALKNRFRPDMPDEITRLATGFGGGSGSGCICGAVAGATMAMGLVVDNDRKRLGSLTKELHKWFAAAYGATCCRVITAEQKGICASLTGKVAGKAAELLL